MCYFNNEIVSPPTLWDPMDSCPPGSSVHGISQARILEWLAVSYLRGSFQPRDQTQVSCIAGGFFTTRVTRESSKVIILIIALLRYNSHIIQLICQKYSIQWFLVCSQNSASSVIVVAQSLSCVQLFVTPWTATHLTVLHYLRVCSNSHPLSQWCHPTISSSVARFSFCHQSFPTSRSFPMNWLFESGSQRIGASTSVLPVNIQGWFHLGLIGLISLLSKGLSRVFSSTTVPKH